MGKFDYDFRAVNPVSYELELCFVSRGRMFDMILKASLRRLRRRGVVVSEGKVKEVSRIDIPGQYLNFVGMAAKGLAGQVFLEVGKDGVKVLSDKVRDCFFVHVGKNWVVHVVYVGEYGMKNIEGGRPK